MSINKKKHTRSECVFWNMQRSKDMRTVLVKGEVLPYIPVRYIK